MRQKFWLFSRRVANGIVLAQREVDAKSDEITAFRPLLVPRTWPVRW
ncbi:hypothetical protein ACWCQ0_29830 [Streptomyces massasporeus]|uniref:Uncharacterized protein n=1 Tax=Streptomyces massasporeus TaxID=67324 RepID=A0ABW6LAJ9_9ACTN